MRVFSHHPRHDGILFFFLFSSNRFHGRTRQEELDRCRSRCPLSTSSNTWKAPLTSMMEFINVLPKLIFRWVDEPQADGLIREKILRYQRCKKNPLAGLENRDWQFNLMLEKNLILFWFFSPSTQTFDVTILTPPKFVTETRSLTNLRSGTVNFTCNVTGNPQPVVEWWVV